MIRPRRVAILFAATAALSITAASLLVAATTGATSDPAPTPPSTQPKPAFAAMDYYDQSCSKCHGPQGSFYGPSLGKDLDDNGLIKVVRDMANGPAQAPLEEPDVAVETAFHRSLMVGTPYLAVTDITGDKWTGEVMPDSKVTLTIGDKKIDAKVDDSSWTADVPTGTKLADITITAELAGKKTTLKPAHSMYSHTEPILPPKERKKN